MSPSTLSLRAAANVASRAPRRNPRRHMRVTPVRLRSSSTAVRMSRHHVSIWSASGSIPQGITGPEVVEAQRRHAHRRGHFRKCSHAPMSAQRLVAKRLANHQPRIGWPLCGRKVQPAEQPRSVARKIQRLGRAGGSYRHGLFTARVGAHVEHRLTMLLSRPCVLILEVRVARPERTSTLTHKPAGATNDRVTSDASGRTGRGTNVPGPGRFPHPRQ